MNACRDTWQNSIEASQALPLTICSMLGPAQLERVNAFNPKSDSSHRPDIDNVLSVYMQNMLMIIVACTGDTCSAGSYEHVTLPTTPDASAPEA